jgi:hypothetical protein
MKKIIIILTICVFLSPSIVSAQYDPGSDGLLKKAGKTSGYDKNKSVDRYTFAEQVGGIIQTVMSLLGIIFTALMVYAGILWMTARGDEDQVKKAKDIIVAAVIGLVVAVGSYSLTDFVVNNIFTETIQSGQTK